MSKKSNKIILYVGTYTENNMQGISAYLFDTLTAETSFLHTTPVNNPSYLTLSANQQYLYAISELDASSAKVHAYTIDKTLGKLIHLNSRPVKGGYPCFINTDGKNVYIANYGGGSLTTYQLDKDGSLGKLQNFIDFNPKDQSYPARLHCVRFAPDSTQLFATDLGSDRIYSFNLTHRDRETILSPTTPAYTTIEKGHGPRHLVFAPKGKHAYLIGERSGKIVAFHYQHRQLTAFQTIASDTVGGHGSADIHLTKDGQFLYASNRLKADGIAIFRIAPDGRLTKVGYQLTGIHPRNFILSPDGKFLLVACRDSNHIEVYRRNVTTGLLEDTGKRIELYHPVCLQWKE